MRFNRPLAYAGALSRSATTLAFAIIFASTLAQDSTGSVADPRAQIRIYHLDDAKADLPYCVFASSKITPSKPAPLIVSLHGWGLSPQTMCNTAAVDLAQQGGYILVAPMGYNRFGWYGSPLISMGTPAAPAPSNQDIQKWSEE